VNFSQIGFLTAPSGEAASTTLIVGEGAIDEAAQVDQEKLSAFAQAGGRLLVLAQTKALDGLPVASGLESREWSSMPFVRTPQHPVLKGITSWDLHFWSPDHVSARGAYSKPMAGPSITLIDSGSETGLEWVQMMEAFKGKGSYLLCQLPVAGAYDKEPMAREMLARLVNYCAGEAAFAQPVNRLNVVAQANSPLTSKLRDLGVAFELVKPEAAGPSSVMLIDAQELSTPNSASKSSEAGSLSKLSQALRDGAVVILHDVWPSEQAMVNELAGQQTQLTVQPLVNWTGRGFRNGFSGLTAGLSHLDFYWKRYEGLESGWNQAEEPVYKIEDLVNWSVRCKTGAEYVFPGALWEIPVGKGRLIIDQVRWEVPSEALAARQGRIVTAMMLGLNVAVEPAKAERSLPRSVAFKPLDLRKLANRGFRDETPDDGLGGWTDQGANIDLKLFPTGSREFGGVPFLIGPEPKSCIVLKSDSRPHKENFPADATIPVGGKIEGLWFLHSAAYTSEGLAGMYQVQYQDGSTLEIPLVNEENIRDWVSPPSAFAREKGTQSRVAWTGTTSVFPTVCVYQMLWVNPRPDAIVRAVKFSNPSRACPVLLAVTTVVKGDRDNQTKAADAAKLFQQAVRELRDGNESSAEALLKKAMTADPSNAAVCQALAQLYDKNKNMDAALAVYQAWTAAGANTPLPYTRAGQILEDRKQYKGALDAYTRSLKIEWNQPPIIEAKSRMEKLAGQ
jgi:hypothetical protein